VSTATTAATKTADCGAGNHATGGGGRTTDLNDDLQSSFPSDAGGNPVTGTNPRYWTAVWRTAAGGGNTHVAYALCVPN
jgi:hypothetical protein